MIVILKDGTKQDQVAKLQQYFEAMGLRIHMSQGENSTIMGLIGDTTRVDAELIASLDAVEAVRRIQEPYKNANRKFHPADTVDRNIGRQQTVQLVGNGHCIEHFFLIKMCHHQRGMYPRVRPSGTYHFHITTQKSRQSLHQAFLHTTPVGLYLPTVIVGSIISQINKIPLHADSSF